MELTLSKFGQDDFGDYLRLVNDATVMAMITERAIPEDEARRDFDKVLAMNAIAPDFGQFRVLDAERGQFIGLGKLEIATCDADQAELGYVLLPDYWGKGIGGRIAKLLIERARRHPQLNGLYAIIDPANLASRKILTNNGFVSREFKDFDGLPGEILDLNW